jgi:hypothetical protein
MEIRTRPCSSASPTRRWRSSAEGLLGPVGQRVQTLVEVDLAHVLERGGQRRVPGGLACPEPCDERLDARPVRRLHGALEPLHRLDVHVGVAQLAERIG